MKIKVTALSLMMLLLLLGGTNAFGQEDDDDDDDQSFDNRINGIVNDAFQQFDERFDTYIFREDPDESGYDDQSDDRSSDDEYSGRWRSHRRRTYSRYRDYSHSLYSGSQNSRLNTAALVSPLWEPFDDHMLLRYNRVEGLFLGLNFPNTYSWNRHSLSLFGGGGYGFAAHRWRYNGGIAQQFGMGRNMIEVGLEGHSLNDTKDRWLADETENSLVSFFAREDYRDYYGRNGVSAWIGWYGKWNYSDMQLRVSYLNDQYESLDRNTGWSLFGGDKVFRENPAIQEGRMKSVLTSFEMHREQQHYYFTSGYKFALSAELAGKIGTSNFSFNRYLVDILRYQPLGRYENLNMRFRAGSTTGDVPVQKGFEIGGVSTLPAYSYKEFAGNRVLLFNAEYLINGRLLDDNDIFPSWLLRNWNFILSYDAGYSAYAAGDEQVHAGFDGLTFNTVKSDWGVGVGTRDGKIRLGFAWRTDVSEPVTVFLRLSRPF